MHRRLSLCVWIPAFLAAAVHAAEIAYPSTVALPNHYQQRDRDSLIDYFGHPSRPYAKLALPEHLIDPVADLALQQPRENGRLLFSESIIENGLPLEPKLLRNSPKLFEDIRAFLEGQLRLINAHIPDGNGPLAIGNAFLDLRTSNLGCDKSRHTDPVQLAQVTPLNRISTKYLSRGRRWRSGPQTKSMLFAGRDNSYHTPLVHGIPFFTDDRFSIVAFYDTFANIQRSAASALARLEETEAELNAPRIAEMRRALEYFNWIKLVCELDRASVPKSPI